MWEALSGLILSVVKWLFGQKQEAEGEQLGKTEEDNQALTEELNDVQKANSAAQSVSSDPDRMRDDPNNRDSPNYKPS